VTRGLDRGSSAGNGAAYPLRGGTAVPLHVLLLAGVLAANGESGLPPAPALVSLIPQNFTCLSASVRHRREPMLREAETLAKYMGRAWAAAASRGKLTDYDSALNLLTVAQQFDEAILNLNPEPTVAEAVARVHAYRAVIVLAQHRLDLIEAGVEKRQFAPGDLCQFSAQLYRFREHLKRCYGPLFARPVFHFRG
jgi:hypothetical protein